MPITLLLMFFLGMGPQSNWKRHEPAKLLKPYGLILAAGLLLGVGLPLLWFGSNSISVATSCSLIFAVLIAMGRDVRSKLKSARAGVWAGLRRLSRSYVGMQLAHLGLLVTVLGVTLTATHSIERDLRMAPGDRVQEGA